MDRYKQGFETMHKYQIHKIKAMFVSQVTEARYFESIKEETIEEVKKSFLTGLIIFWLYSLFDFLFFKKSDTGPLFLSQVFATVSTVILVLFLKRVNTFQFFYGLISFNLFILLGVAILTFIYQPADPTQMALVQLIFIMAITLLIPNTFVNSMFISIVSGIIFSYINFLNSAHLDSSLMIIFGAFFAYNIFIFQFDRKSQILNRLKFRELVKEQKYIRVLSKEILKRTELEKKLTEMACTDSLTGACNRGYFIDMAEHEKRKSHRQGTSLSVMLIDIDDFKAINDTFGHAIGDKALKKFMKICKSTIRESDVIGRLGGEEFAILCSDSDLKQTFEIAKRLCNNVNNQTLKLEYHFTISIGVAEVRAEYKSIDKALHMADLALYEAKKEGKNRAKVAEAGKHGASR